MFNVQGERAISLLRASDEKQTDSNNDLPIQRKIVNAFIEKEELILVREFTEGGVSGYKTKVEDRVAIQNIKKLAKNKEFDVLVVYRVDRIGRKDEFYQEVKYLNKCGIRIITTDGKELKTKTFADKLMTQIEFMSSENESEGTSQRVSDFQSAMIQEGRFRGGYIPYGYKLVNNGSTNFKGRFVYDLTIDDNQAEVVKLIYNLSIKNNLGARAIASYLNTNGYKHLSRNDDGWSFTSINYILSNTTYKGYLFMNNKKKEEKILSEKQEDLVIIPEEVWELNQQVLKNRKTTGEKDDKLNEQIGITQGKSLLSGLVYCGHCTNKMHLWNNHKYYFRKNNEKVKIIKSNYRCKSALSSNKINCEGQSTYSSTKIDNIVEEEVINFVIKLQDKKMTEELKQNLLESHKHLLSEKKEKNKLITEKQKELLILKKEIPKAIQKKSDFTTQQLNESIDIISQECNELLKELNGLDKKIIESKISINEFNEINLNTETWIEKYKKSELAEQKVMIAEIISKVYVYNDKVKISFKPTWLTFKENCENNNGSERVSFALPNKSNTQPIFFEKIIKFPVAS